MQRPIRRLQRRSIGIRRQGRSSAGRRGFRPAIEPLEARRLLAAAALPDTAAPDGDSPQIEVGDISLREGNSGTTSFRFPVSLSKPTERPITLSYATRAGTAEGMDDDYRSLTGAISLGGTRPIGPAFAPYGSFSGGVRVASGDVNGDGVADLITSPGPGGGPHVKVFDGTDQSEIFSFLAYGLDYSRGLYVAAGDVNDDGKADIITGADAGGGPHVQVFDGADPENRLASFFAYGMEFTGGVRVAAGDVNGDDIADLITAPGPGGGPNVKVFDLTTSTTAPANSLFAFAPDFLGGVFVAGGDVNADGYDDIIVAPDAGGGPHVRVFSGADTSVVLANLFPYSADFTGGVRVAAVDLDGDDQDEIVTAPGPGGGPLVKVFDGTTSNLVDSFLAFDSAASPGTSLAAASDRIAVGADEGGNVARFNRSIPQVEFVVVDVVGDDLEESDEQFFVDFAVTDAAGQTITLASPVATGTIIDDDTPGIEITGAATLVTDEAGGTASFLLALNSPPTTDVRVDVTSSDASEGTVTTPAGGILVFTPNNWATPQPVVVAGEDDVLADGYVDYSIDLDLTTNDSEYAVVLPPTISATNLDDEPLTLLVTTLEDEDEPGLFPDGGEGLSLREAIRVANEHAGHDTIFFDGALTDAGPGTLVLQPATTPVDRLTLFDDVTIVGTGADVLAIDGNHDTGILAVEAGVNAELRGLTLRRGKSDSGGGILNFGTLRIVASALMDNIGLLGGGVFNQGNLEIVATTLSGNLAEFDGGGVFNAQSADMPGSIHIVNSTLSQNTAWGDGGAIWSEQVAGQPSAPLQLRNTTVTLNMANADQMDGGVGAGLWLQNSDVVIDNTMIAGNQRHDEMLGSDAPDDIFRSAAPSNSDENLVTAHHSLFGDPATAGQPIAGNNNLIGQDGGLYPLAEILDPALANNGGTTQTHALIGGSPAIDAGDAFLAVAPTSESLQVDQRGRRRVYGEQVDIGAFEFHVLEPPAADPGGPYAVNEDDAILLDGAQVFDANDPESLLQVAWDLDGDGVFGETGAAAVRGDETLLWSTFVATGLEGPAEVVVTLRVVDTDANAAEVSTTVTVNPIADPPHITGPATVLEDPPDPVMFTIHRNPFDGDEVTHVALSELVGGMVWLPATDPADPPTLYTAGTWIELDAEGTRPILFTPTLDFNGTAGFSAMGAVDGSGGGAGAPTTASFTVQPVNDAPVIFGPQQLATIESISFQLPDAFEVRDVDLMETDGAKLSVSLSASQGTFLVAENAPVSIAQIGQRNLGWNADEANAAAVFPYITYLPDQGFHGHDVLDISVSDKGATGSGNRLTTTFQVDVSVEDAAFDFGDAPQLPRLTADGPGDPRYPTTLARNGARHVTGGTLRLGSVVDAEPDGLPSLGAHADDGTASPDEDGIGLPAGLVPGSSDVPIVVTVSGGAAKLDAWIDWNRDGDWSDADEQIAASRDVMDGENQILVDVPGFAAGTRHGDTYARFRLSSAGGLSPVGPALDGEVEDYVLQIGAAASELGGLAEVSFQPQQAGHTWALRDALGGLLYEEENPDFSPLEAVVFATDLADDTLSIDVAELDALANIVNLLFHAGETHGDLDGMVFEHSDPAGEPIDFLIAVNLSAADVSDPGGYLQASDDSVVAIGPLVEYQLLQVLGMQEWPRSGHMSCYFTFSLSLAATCGTGLDPVDATAVAVNELAFALPSTANDLLVERLADGSGTLSIVSRNDTFESAMLPGPEGLLTLVGGSGPDTIELIDLTPADLLVPFIANGNGGDDLFDLRQFPQFGLLLGDEGNDRFLVETLAFPILDGGEGRDVIEWVGAGTVTDFTAESGGLLESIELFDIRGSGPNLVRLDTVEVEFIVGDGGALDVLADGDDTVELGGGWRVTGSEVRDDRFYRTIEQVDGGTARVNISGPHDWQNPLLPLDVNADNIISPGDLLILINELNHPDYLGPDLRLVDAKSVPEFPLTFFDTNGDGYAAPNDVLRGINYLNSLSSPSLAAEAEARQFEGKNVAIQVERSDHHRSCCSAAAPAGGVDSLRNSGIDLHRRKEQPPEQRMAPGRQPASGVRPDLRTDRSMATARAAARARPVRQEPLPADLIAAVDHLFATATRLGNAEWRELWDAGGAP